MEILSPVRSPSFTIRESNARDLKDLLDINRKAFGSEVEPDLVNKLLVDATAQPVLSLIATSKKKPIAHVLYTKVTIDEFPDLKAMILAPVAVVPSDQKKGIGSAIIERGLEMLRESDVQLVFVLGHPEYYPRCGFHPAAALGFNAPYPIPLIHTDAWMVQELKPGMIQKYHGTIRCAKTLDKPEYWAE